MAFVGKSMLRTQVAESAGEGFERGVVDGRGVASVGAVEVVRGDGMLVGGVGSMGQGERVAIGEAEVDLITIA